MVVGGQPHVLAALPLGKTRYPLCRRLGGLQGRCGWLRKILPSSEFNLWHVQPVVSCYTSYAILAQGFSEIFIYVCY